MWIQQREWILQVSKAESIMLDGESIRIFWRENKNPDQLDFKDDDEAEVVYKQIVENLRKESTVIDIPG